jgi:hypothetical protein
MNYLGSPLNPGVERHLGKYAAAAMCNCTCLYRRCICCCYEWTFNPAQMYSINDVKAIHDSSYFITVLQSIKYHEPYESNPHRRIQRTLQAHVKPCKTLLKVNLYTQFLFLLLANTNPLTACGFQNSERVWLQHKRTELWQRNVSYIRQDEAQHSSLRGLNLTAVRPVTVRLTKLLSL